LHVGIFWGIGRYILNNKDTITIMVDDKTLFDHLSRKEESHDDFIKTRIYFITKLIDQRKLKINYELADKEEKLTSELS